MRPAKDKDECPATPVSQDLNSEEAEFVAEAAAVEGGLSGELWIPPSPPPPPPLPVVANSNSVSDPKNKTLRCPYRTCHYVAEGVKNPRDSLRSHLMTCTERRALLVREEHADWTHEQHLRELEKQLEEDFLVSTQRRWCPGPKCIFILYAKLKKHDHCGWKSSVPPVKSSGPAAEFRPSSLTESREAVVRNEDEAFGAGVVPPMFLEGLNLPPLSEAALSRKRIYDPFVRPFSPQWDFSGWKLCQRLQLGSSTTIPSGRGPCG